MKLIEILFFIYLALFPFGQLTRLPVPSIKAPEIHLYLTDLALTGLVACWLGWKLLRRGKFILPPLAKPIFFFSFFALLSLLINTPLLSGREVVVSGLYLARWLVYAGLYFVVFDIKERFKWLKPVDLLNFLISIGVTIALFGLVQYFLWPDLKALRVLEWDPHYYRVVGTFLDPGFTGMLLALTLILVVIKCADTSSGHWSNRRWLFFGGLIAYIALALTYSRASYLAYLTGMGIIAWMKKAPKFFLTIFLVGALTLLILPRPAGEGGKLGRRYSIEARIRNWQNSLVIIRDNPIIGVGFNTYRYAQRDYGFLEEDKWEMTHAGAGADSSLLFVFATTGILGLIAYLWLWWKIIQTKNLIILASAAALLAHSFFLDSLFYSWIMAWMWILLGVFQAGKFKGNN